MFAIAPRANFAKKEIMQKSIVLALCTLASLSLSAQHLDVESNGRLVGKLNIIAAEGDSSVFIGANAGLNDGGGNLNTFVGGNAGRANTSGRTNSFFGINAGRANTSGDANSFFGKNAGFFNTEGFANSFFGINAGFSNSSGSRNSFFGVNAGFFNTEGDGNSFFGPFAGSWNTTGSSNVYIGKSAASQINGDDNIMIGNAAGPLDPDVLAGALTPLSNRLYIHNDHTPDPLIYGEFDNRRLGVNTGSPRAMFTMRGPDDDQDGPTAYLYGDNSDQTESGRIRFVEATASDNWRGAYIHYDGDANYLHIGRHATNSNSTADDKNVISIHRSNGTIDLQGEVILSVLSTSGAQPLCLNAQNRIGPCSSSSSTARSATSQDFEKVMNIIHDQQQEISNLKKQIARMNNVITRLD